MDLMEFLKRSKDASCTEECYVRFKVKKLEDGRLVLTKNIMSKDIDNGELSMSLILDKNGNPILTTESPVGIISLDDVEQMFNGCVVDLNVPNGVAKEDVDGLNINLGDSELEYSTISAEEAKEFFFPMDSLSLDFLRTDTNQRKMGFAKRMVAEADKFAILNGFGSMSGMGIPFDRNFCIENKTLNDWGFIMQYKKTCERKRIKFDPVGAVVNLAVFYKRLGFDIYPIDSGYFLIEKRVSDTKPTKNDAMFLKGISSSLDEDAVLFEK